MANYITDLNELVPYSRLVMLPKGDPVNFGNIVFLFSRSFSESVDMINSNLVRNDRKYKYYFYESNYYLKVYNTPYRILDLKRRGELYQLIGRSARLLPHPRKPINENEFRNVYFDMHKYLELYYNGVKDAPIVKRVEIFSSYIKTIINSANLRTADSNGFDYRALMIDITKYPMKDGKLIEKLDNPVYMIYYLFYKYFNLISTLDIDIIMYSDNMVMHFNPKNCDERSYILLKNALGRMSPKHNIVVTSDDERDLTSDKIKTELKEKLNFMGDDENEELNDEIDNKVDIATDDAEKSLSDIGVADSDGIVAQQLTSDVINDDKELVGRVYDQISKAKVPSNPISSKRDQMLREKQKQIKVNGLTIDELGKINGKEAKLKKRDVSKVVHTLNDNMKNISFAEFDKCYNDELLTKDIIGAFASLNDKDIPMTITSIDVKDTSDTLNYKETYYVKLVDVNGVNHSITVDLPKLYEDKFLYLGGNKKIIDKQNFLLPVVKTGPDTVQIVTNYNKAFIRRVDTKSLSNVERFKKMMGSTSIDKYVTYGTCFDDNTKELSVLEYDELSKIITEYHNGSIELYFSQKKIKELDKDGISDDFSGVPEGFIHIGYDGKKPIFVNIEEQKVIGFSDGYVDYGMGIVEFMVEGDVTLREEFKNTKAGKRLMYTSITVMAQAIPLVVLLSFWEGITTVLKKADIEYHFERSAKNIQSGMGYIKLSDGYLVYKKDVASQLLLNGLNVLDLSRLTFDDLNEKEAYIQYFIKVYGKAIITSALQNFYIWMIDNITKEVLETLDLPTDIVSLCLYANDLLVDNGYRVEVVQDMSRVRSNEMIPAILYTKIANAYIDVRNSGGSRKLSIPKDAVIKELLKQQTVEDYSTLNPIVEVGKSTIITAKGWRGANVPEAYNELKRSFDKSMLGIIGMSSSPDANVGVMRSLTMEPLVVSARGFVDTSKPIEELKDVNLFSIPELLTSNSATKDDSIRTAMAVKQSKHVIPTVKSSPVLISNGSEETIRFHLSSDFVVNADEDGKIIEYDESAQIMVVEYKSGKHRAIDLSAHVVKNGAGGFYLENQLVSSLKVGDKFKKDEPLAHHKNFFTPSKLNGTRMNMGPLLKVACAASYNTYQDSGFITKKASRELASELVFRETVVIGKNANVDKFASVGDEIEIGDVIVQSDTSYDEIELNKFLSSLSADQQAAVNENAKSTVKSHYAGTITDIKISSPLELDELSPSLKKIVKAYYNRISGRKKVLDKYCEDDSINKCGILFTENTDVVKPNMYGVIKGEKVNDGVLIEFFIKYVDIMGVGDKGANFTALKFINGETIPEGYEPYSEFRPEEEVSLTFSNNGVLKRMTTSVLPTMFANKCIIEHKRKLKEIYDR